MKIILIRERFFESLGKDIVSIASVCFGMFFNYVFCGNSKIMSGAFILVLFSKGFNSLKKESKTFVEAKAQIEKWEKESFKEGVSDE